MNVKRPHSGVVLVAFWCLDRWKSTHKYDTHVPQNTAYLVRTALGRFYVKASCHGTGLKFHTFSPLWNQYGTPGPSSKVLCYRAFMLPST